MAATTAVYQLEIPEDELDSTQSHQTAWAQLRFLLDILQRTATAMPGLNRSIDIIRTRVKRILDRQASRHLDSLFPTKGDSPRHGDEQPTNNPSRSVQSRNEDISRNTRHGYSPDDPIDHWEANIIPTVMDEPRGWDLWLPAFPAQDISYGSEVMLDVQDSLSPRTRAALMGSNLDAQLQLNLPVPGDSTWNYSPFSNT